MSPAFKEWHVIVEALGSGEQLLILRKGGIAEGRGGFDAERASRFWLFPTQFHAQAEKTKPSAARWFASAASEPAINNAITLRYFAEVVCHRFLDDWKAVDALSSHHFWTTDAVREKFDWSQPPGLHAFVVRVHKLREPLVFTPTPAMSGCKSWIELPFHFDEHPSDPVLDEKTFAVRRAEIGLDPTS